MKVFIVVLVWNAKEVSEKCLTSITKLTYPASVVVVDNGSSDDTFEYLSKRFPQFTLIRNKRNLGFSGGINVGVSFALEKGAEAVVVMNNDTEVDSHFLEPIISRLEKDEAVGLISPYIFREVDKSLWFGGGKIIYPWCRPVHKEGSLDFLSGCCLAIKREVFEKIGLFDKDYFFYYEDIDFCLRAKREGFLLAVEPSSKVYHKVSYSLEGSASPKALYYTLRNNLLLIKRYVYGLMAPFSYFYVFVLSLKIMLWRQSLGINSSVFGAWSDFINGKFGERR